MKYIFMRNINKFTFVMKNIFLLSYTYISIVCFFFHLLFLRFSRCISRGWVSWCLASLDAPEECLECFVYPLDHILQNVSTNLLILSPDFCLDLSKRAHLLKSTDRFLGILPSFFALLERGIVELTAPVQSPLESSSLLLRGVDAVFKRLYHAPALLSV